MMGLLRGLDEVVARGLQWLEEMAAAVSALLNGMGEMACRLPDQARLNMARASMSYGDEREAARCGWAMIAMRRNSRCLGRAGS